MDCEACFLKTLHTSDQWTLWKSFVEFRCRIGVNFAILITSKEKFSTAGRYGAARADQRWLRAPAGFSGLRTKGFSWDAWTSGIAAPEAGFRFRANQSRRSSCWNLRGTNSSRSGRSSGSGRQRRTVAESCGELRRWDRPSTGSTDLGCTINIGKATLCVDITFGNSFAESPSSRFKLPLATCKSEKQAAGWRLGECAPCGMLRGPLAPPLEVPCVPCLKVHRY